MAFEPTPEEQAQKLRTIESAAASAIGWYCTPEDIRAAVEAGIADGCELEATLRGADSGEPSNYEPSPDSDTVTPSATPALDRFVAQFRR